MIDQWLSTYQCKSQADVHHAKREIIQYIALAGLARSDFFEKASFYGGTALRILYGMERFSEDIDFSLNEKNNNFSLERYFHYIVDECNLLNLHVDLSIKDKVNPNAVESAFLKDNTEWSVVTFKDKISGIMPDVKIKIEIDRNPPLNFEVEQKLITKPYSFYLTAMREEFLFAGKMHALLFREWKTRIKGRDWYDMEWYIRRGTKLHLGHLETRAKESAHFPADKSMTTKTLKQLLKDKIDRLDVESALMDIRRFVVHQETLQIWSRQYFHDLVDKISIVEG
jgi:predicted nucleotidyltransferase component of viral defense system